MTLDRVSTHQDSHDEAALASVEYAAKRVRRLERHSPLTAWRAELQDAIRYAHQAGHSYRAIAEAAGISHQRVAQLLQKEEKCP